MSDNVSQETSQGTPNRHLIAGGVSLAGLVTLAAVTSYISCDTSRDINFYAPLLLAAAAAYQAGLENASNAVTNTAMNAYSRGKSYATSMGLFSKADKSEDTAAAEAQVQAKATRRHS